MKAIACATFAALTAMSCATHLPVTTIVARAQSALTIEPANAEVWAWSIDVRGESDTELTSCRTAQNGAWSTANVSGRRWRARVRLTPGANDVRAECRDHGGGLHASPPARFEAMLRDVPTARIRTTSSGDDALLDAS